MALCTQTDVEQKLQIDFDLDDEPVVAALIADAQALIETEVGRPLESDDYTEVFDGGRVHVHVDHWPITEVAAVTEDGDPLTALTDFRWYPNGKIIRVAGGYQVAWRTQKTQAITVEYTGGYLAAAGPGHVMALEHLGSLCAEVVARAFKEGVKPTEAAGLVQSVSLAGSDTVTYETGVSNLEGVNGFVFLTPDERFQLARYQRFSFGFA